MFDLNISAVHDFSVSFRCTCKGYNQTQGGLHRYPERYRSVYICTRHWVWFQDCAQHALRYIPRGSYV